ncbi:MAG: YggS family pyridoxal phosphate-dependent enzyme [Anaerolineae bacterium]|nr:YggS family pyridoxal phosphate-dependent enzyme [Anaerolineae bacterium]
MVALLAERITAVRTGIAHACANVGRDPQAVTLVAVSKTHPASAVLEAVEAGLHQFGENRVEEAAGKIAAVNAQCREPLTWHMIGHLQSRKARDAANLFDVVQSVDSVRLASKLAQALPEGQVLTVLLECNVSGEASKGGFVLNGWERDPAVLADFARSLGEIAALPGLSVRGLMTMAPIADDMELVRPVFRSLRVLRDALEQSCGMALPVLSMGMTDDFPVAIEEGATMIRVGRALFGERAAL